MYKKFDAIDYLVNKYVDDGEHATIPLILTEKNRFFNKYDPTFTSLSPDVYNYLDKCSYNIPVEYKIKVEVVCNNLDEPTKEKMQEALRNHYGVKVFDNNIDIRANNRKAFSLAVLGTIFVLIVYLGESLLNFTSKIAGTTQDVIKEILTVTGWVFIWSAIENIAFDRRKLREDKRDNIQMMNAVLIFKSEKEYYKELSQEQNEDQEEYDEIRESFLT